MRHFTIWIMLTETATQIHGRDQIKEVLGRGLRARSCLSSLVFLCLAAAVGANAQSALIASPPPLSANSRNGDPLVVAASTGLTWAGTPSLWNLVADSLSDPTVDVSAWAQPLEECKNADGTVGYGRYTDWRLPSIRSSSRGPTRGNFWTGVAFVNGNTAVYPSWEPASSGPGGLC